jgi:hypothetical protein
MTKKHDNTVHFQTRWSVDRYLQGDHKKNVPRYTYLKSDFNERYIK